MSSKASAGALMGLAAAAPLSLFLFGYTVDDALITARVASQWAAGHGYHFNKAGPATDAVTPLGFAHLLAAFGPGTPIELLDRARVLGVVAWLIGAALLGRELWKVRPAARAVAFALLALSAPLAAWAGSGMETGLLALLGCAALLPGWRGALAAGVAAGLRPELVPWALAIGPLRSAFGPAAGRAGRVALALALALAPALAAASIRAGVFGSPAPLSVLAKPSDLSHGLRYAFAAFVFGGAPLLLLAPRAWARADAETRVLCAAAFAHFGALALAGGDWMALYRLLVPVLPTALLAGARLGEFAQGPAFVARALLAVAASVFVLIDTGLPARHVLEHRRALIERSRAVLEGGTSIATLDIGWVGAATEARIVDLAGVTDPTVAALPGGHTSKRVPEELLRARGTDVWVLLLAPEAVPEHDWRESAFARAVEQRLARMDLAREFEVAALLPLGGTRQSYLVVRRSAARDD